jgi:hypothetical protein
MLSGDLALFARVTLPLAGSVLAYCVWRSAQSRSKRQGLQGAWLLSIYVISRSGIWFIFAIFMQDYVSTSDPRLYYTVQLEHFLAGDVPIRDFYYPYGALLLPSMLPMYVFSGHSLAGISLFAIAAEAVALFFFLKSTCLLEQRGEIDQSWPRQALTLYLLNPATLYWTVFQGYHSIVQTAYSMAALYFLLRDRPTMGYALGLLGVAGAKVLAVLDWPALLVVCRPNLTKLFWGALPLVVTYIGFQIITGDIMSPIRFHVGFTGEGNVWYLTTLFGDLHDFYSAFPGDLLPIFSFSIPFLLGCVLWVKYFRLGLTSFSFQAAMGITTFTMCLFFLFSLYTGSYYVPMLMLPASLVVTCPTVPNRYGIWLLLLISGMCVAGDAIWASLGQPDALIKVYSSGSFKQQLLTSLLVATILVRIACFAKLAALGFRAATTAALDSRIAVPGSGSGLQTKETGTIRSCIGTEFR